MSYQVIWLQRFVFVAKRVDATFMQEGPDSTVILHDKSLSEVKLVLAKLPEHFWFW